MFLISTTCSGQAQILWYKKVAHKNNNVSNIDNSSSFSFMNKTMFQPYPVYTLDHNPTNSIYSINQVNMVNTSFQDQFQSLLQNSANSSKMNFTLNDEEAFPEVYVSKKADDYFNDNLLRLRIYKVGGKVNVSKNVDGWAGVTTVNYYTLGNNLDFDGLETGISIKFK